MIQTVYLDDFRQAFHNMGRGDQFSYEALELIFDYLEECDPDSELDVIAICCDFCEMTMDEILDSYDIVDADPDYFADEDDKKDEVIRFLENSTSVVGETDSTIVFINF